MAVTPLGCRELNTGLIAALAAILNSKGNWFSENFPRTDEPNHSNKKKKSAFSQFLKAQPNKHESLIVDKFTCVSVVQTSYVDHKQPFFLIFFFRN